MEPSHHQQKPHHTGWVGWRITCRQRRQRKKNNSVIPPPPVPAPALIAKKNNKERYSVAQWRRRCVPRGAQAGGKVRSQHPSTSGCTLWQRAARSATHARLYQAPFRPCKARVRFCFVGPPQHCCSMPAMARGKCWTRKQPPVASFPSHPPSLKRGVVQCVLVHTGTHTLAATRIHGDAKKTLQAGVRPKKGGAQRTWWWCGEGETSWLRRGHEGGRGARHAEARKQTKTGAKENSSPLTKHEKKTPRQKRGPTHKQEGRRGATERRQQRQRNTHTLTEKNSEKRVPYNRRAAVGRRRQATLRRS